MTNFTMLARDRKKLLRQALCGLVGTDTNVTILDDRSAEDVQILLSFWDGQYDSHVIRNEAPMGTGPLRNLVVAENEKRFGRGDYLYLSDSDVAFLPGWLDKLIAAYEYAWSYGYRVLGGYNHPFHQPVSRIDGVYQVNALASQSMLMRWEVWDSFGPFVQTPVDKVCQSEDVDFSNRITAAGYKVGVIDPAVVVNTGITNSFGEKIPGWEMVKAACPKGVICE